MDTNVLYCIFKYMSYMNYLVKEQYIFDELKTQIR